MDSQMYQNPIFKENKRRLEGLGYHFLAPEVGRLASGREGPGRLPSEERVLQAIEKILIEGQLLRGLKVLVTAGPTRERLDPIRCITSRSSGRMGYALAAAARELGGQVLLVSGPTQLQPPPGVVLIKVESAEEMGQAVLSRAGGQDLIVMAAAVADWRPKSRAAEKLDKSDQEELTVELEQTPDILKELGSQKPSGQILSWSASPPSRRTWSRMPWKSSRRRT